ncbi:hypothetical protein CP533_3055 [Ophiocordyceps camponoti-saundersi (nom. inval.)]|nr:hypothetical protein CP533_3055 [Ophiocordyceps camponoti-saundersi (nom. inval.)]
MADSNAPKPSSSVKLVLLGEAAVGKSSLVLRFVNNDFQENKEPTIGAAFLTQKCNLPTRTIKFEIWDTAGQERFASLAPMYYRNAQAALVVFDLTKATSLVKAKHWVAELQRQASPGIVIALVGNKLDLAGEQSPAESSDADDGQAGGDARKVSTEEAQAYAEEESLLFFETSAKTGHNVSEVFTAIANAIPETSLKSARGAGAAAAAAGGRAGDEQRVNLGSGRDAGAKDGSDASQLKPQENPQQKPPETASASTRPDLPHVAAVRSFEFLHLPSSLSPKLADDMAFAISEAQAELIRSFSPDDIPLKLRCAICSKLAVNAFRLPCCEQAICETCMETKICIAPENSDPNGSSPGQSSLPLSCPVCEHTPLAAEDCNVNKSLRTTIRVFLRTAEKKKEANRAKESKDSVPATPIDAPKPSFPDAEPAVEGPSAGQPAIGAAVAQQQQESDRSLVQDVTHAAEKSDPSLDNGPWTKQTEHTSAADPVSAGNQDTDSNDVQEAVRNVQGPEEMANGQVGFAMDGSFPNPNMMYSAGGDFNQMQMMMAMQNGMGNASYGGFPMMGMALLWCWYRCRRLALANRSSGMNMDPMTMQSMYMNGGFQGMGMGGYGGGYGQGSNNNWNGAQSWSYDYNHGGDYGNMTAGFQTGYNQGSYGGHFNDYRRNNFGRGRGRGRGLYGGFGGRGGHYQDNQDQGGFYPQPDARRPGDEGGQGMMGLRSAAVAVAATATAGGGGEMAEAAGGDTGGQLASSRENLGNEAASGDVLSRNSTAGAIRSVLSTPDVPINAPTGPKAMRQGLPNTSLHNLRARGYQVDGAVDEARGRSRSPDREAEHRRQDQQDDRGHCEQRHPENVDEPSSTEKVAAPDRPSTPISPPPPTLAPNKAKRSRSRSPSRSRSRSRHRSPSRSRGGRHRRPLSPPTEGDGQSSSRRRKRPRGGRKHGGEHYTPSKDERRSRSVSVERTSHRGHTKDKERRERRSHRERSRDRGRDRDYDYDHSSRRERERRDRRDDDEDRHRRRHHHHHNHHNHHHHRRDPTSPSPDRKAVPDLVRRSSAAAAMTNSSTTNHTNAAAAVVTDPHTMEREARNRERLLKEAQRIAGLAGSKRGRDTSDEGLRRGRRAVRRSDEDEERMRRLEVEREGGRWD